VLRRVKDEARHRLARGRGRQFETALRGGVDPDLEALFFEVRALTLAVRSSGVKGRPVCSHGQYGM
jgi:hypothetical protein